MGEAYIVRRGGAASAGGEDETGRKYLYNAGDEMDSITGGWAETADGSGVCTFEESSILLETTASLTRKGVVTNSAIDTTGYSKVCMDADVLACKGGTTQVKIGVHTSNKPVVGTSSGTSTCTTVYPYSGVERMRVSYDVRALTSGRYVWTSLANASAASIRILKIWLE